LAHLVDSESAAHHDLVFDIVRTVDGCELQSDGAVVFSDASLDAIVTSLFGSLMQRIYDRRESLIGMHAAAVACRDRCILMPGASGSGKSTFTAGVLYAGLTYLGDEVITLERETRHAVPLPLALNLKPDSLSVLQPFVGRRNVTRQIQYGERRIHYLLSPQYKVNPPDRCYPVSHIVFPRFRKGEAVQLRALPAADVLQRLIETQSRIDRPHDVSDIKRLLQWIERTPAFEMRFGSLSDGVEKILELMEGEADASHLSQELNTSLV
jgi:hypothetical protein